MTGHPIPVCCGEAEGYVVARDATGWVAVHITDVNDNDRFSVRETAWLRPMDLDVFGEELAAVLAEARVVAEVMS